jgi:maleylacetate reductase
VRVRSFEYEPLPTRVVFGAGAVGRLPAEVAALRLARVLVLCTPGQEPLGERLAAVLGPLAAGVLAEARMHVPAGVADRAVAAARAVGADGCLAVGGGSAVGLAKAVALESGLPILAVPTTYAGSEMTPVWGRTAEGHKTTGRDLRVLPRTVVYDPELTLSLPPAVSLASAMNAIAHAVEAGYAPDLTPVIGLQAAEGIRALAGALPGIVTADDPSGGDRLAARADALYGAWLCGSCLAATTMGLHHKLCHALGGALDLPHAQTHAVVLPYAVAYNAPAAPAAMAALRDALRTGEHPALTLWRLSTGLGGPRSLRELGMRQDDVARIAELVGGAAFANPREVTRAGVTGLLAAAWAGDRPVPAG